LNASLSSLKIENEKLIAKAKDLNVCNISISNLRDENAILNAKIDELNACKPCISTVSLVSICTRCRDVNIDAIHDKISMIKQQNDHIAKLYAKIAEHELENENLNLLVVCFIVGDALTLRMALASNREAMSNPMPVGGLRLPKVLKNII
jgi:serine protease inhibitor